jgi:hypothetical protein
MGASVSSAVRAVGHTTRELIERLPARNATASHIGSSPCRWSCEVVDNMTMAWAWKHAFTSLITRSSRPDLCSDLLCTEYFFPQR